MYDTLACVVNADHIILRIQSCAIYPDNQTTTTTTTHLLIGNGTIRPTEQWSPGTMLHIVYAGDWTAPHTCRLVNRAHRRLKDQFQ